MISHRYKRLLKSNKNKQKRTFIKPQTINKRHKGATFLSVTVLFWMVFPSISAQIYLQKKPSVFYGRNWSMPTRHKAMKPITTLRCGMSTIGGSGWRWLIRKNGWQLKTPKHSQLSTLWKTVILIVSRNKPTPIYGYCSFFSSWLLLSDSSI